MSEAKLFQCLNKTHHASRAEAEAEVQRLMNRDRASGIRGRRTRAFRCVHDMWVVGRREDAR